MNKWGTFAASVAAAGVLAAGYPLCGWTLAGTVQSGLQPGEHMTQFDVTDVSGPAKGQTLCYV